MGTRKEEKENRGPSSRGSSVRVRTVIMGNSRSKARGGGQSVLLQRKAHDKHILFNEKAVQAGRPPLPPLPPPDLPVKDRPKALPGSSPSRTALIAARAHAEMGVPQQQRLRPGPLKTRRRLSSDLMLLVDADADSMHDGVDDAHTPANLNICESPCTDRCTTTSSRPKESLSADLAQQLTPVLTPISGPGGLRPSWETSTLVATHESSSPSW